MNSERKKSNQVRVAGKVAGNFVLHHELYGEGFYTGMLQVARTSGTYDMIPIMVSDRLIKVTADWNGCYLAVTGQFRSHNKDGRCLLSVHAMEVEVLDGPEKPNRDNNIIILDGFLCKVPKFRETPLGREITDLHIAVNREYGKSDYIPCICWGRNARYAARFEVGAHCTIRGRIQSREYEKKLEDGSSEVRTAWEVSVQTIQLEQKEEDKC